MAKKPLNQQTKPEKGTISIHSMSGNSPWTGKNPPPATTPKAPPPPKK